MDRNDFQAVLEAVYDQRPFLVVSRSVSRHGQSALDAQVLQSISEPRREPWDLDRHPGDVQQGVADEEDEDHEDTSEGSDHAGWDRNLARVGRQDDFLEEHRCAAVG